MSICERGVFYNITVLEPLNSLCSALISWRKDPEIQRMEKEKAKGRILGFVKGLRFSAQLIYIIRDVLSRRSLEADWGHLMFDDGRYLSPECDIVIHEPGFLRQWNGRHDPIMDFKFIDVKQTLVVISCKSFITPGQVDAQYSKSLKQHVKNLWLFAECCDPRSLEKIKDSAHASGYDKCWCLYTWNKKTAFFSSDEREWLDFVRALEKLVSSK